MATHPIARYEFGPFALDVSRRVLQRAGETVPLAPKALELLLAFVERPREVLTKREILQRVWPDTFVEEANVAQNISLLRKALGDTTGAAQLIVTIPRWGYQFAANVLAVPVQASRSLAVFPFTSMAAEEPGRSLGSLFAGALAESLRRLPSLFVQTLDANGDEHASLARAAAAEMFVVGHYRCRGTAWHVAMRLFRTSDATLLKSAAVQGTFTTANDAREAVCAEVLAALQPLLSDERPPLSSTSEPASRESFRNYLRGRHLWNKRTAGALEEAFGCAVQAVEADPTSVRGHVGIADTYNLLGGQHGVLTPHEAFPRARAAANRALEIDPSCGAAHASLAFVSCWYDWDYDAAERNFRRATELEPTYATAHHWWAEALACAGRFAESFAHFDTAMVLDPLSSAIRTDFAAALSLAGDYEQCEATIAEVLKFDPAFVRGLVALAMNAERKRDYPRAHELALRSLEQEASPAMLALTARVAAAMGLRDEARARLAELERLQSTHNVVSCELAGVHAALESFDRAEELIERSFARREPHVMWMLRDPAYDSLRAHTDLVRRWNALSSRA